MHRYNGKQFNIHIHHHYRRGWTPRLTPLLSVPAPAPAPLPVAVPAPCPVVHSSYVPAATGGRMGKIILASSFIFSEVLPFVDSVKSNGILHTIVNEVSRHIPSK